MRLESESGSDTGSIDSFFEPNITWIPGLEGVLKGIDADNGFVQASMFDRAEMVKWMLFRGVFMPFGGSGTNRPKNESVGQDQSAYESIAKTIADIHDAENSVAGGGGKNMEMTNRYNLVTPQGITTALILSSKHPGSLSTLSILLTHPLTDANVCDGSPLAWCSRMGCLDGVKLLVAHGADPLIRNGVASLWAAEHGHTDVVKYFVAHGFMDIHAQEEYCLRWAVARGHLDTVAYLCGRGASVDAMGGFALRHAVQMGHAAIVDVLLAAGADVRVASRVAAEREGVDDSPRCDSDNALVRWAERAGNAVLAEKLRTALRGKYLTKK
ncbi:ankyrin repeat-containing domain protein [Obelidium mucronatum]|nr:ankyrin repeat-containing domain protein [Obelidium mucronatum]